MSSVQPVANNDDSSDNLAILDDVQFNEIKDLFEDDFELLMQNYIQDSQKQVKRLQAALSNADNAAGFESAHALKGASANVGATKLHQLCYQMQEICRANKISENKDLLTQIEQQVKIVNEEIQQRLLG